ncbi:hypothetical protein [Pseudonocardia sp.]|uniref:hypothetical protein n=1 Tax=Pseudonocardia sp. TaxID=60912 RepID=UPI003D12F7E2
MEISEAPTGIATEAAALEIARDHGVPAHRLIAADTEGTDVVTRASVTTLSLLLREQPFIEA